MTPDAQQIVREVRPEVNFWAMNWRKPMAFSKRTPQGERERKEALSENGFDLAYDEGLGKPVRVLANDFFDACAALWTARRVRVGIGGRMPMHPDLDAKVLDQAIWF